MTTVVLTYRNRDTNILDNCLKSFQNQTSNAFKVVLVNYGSDDFHSNYLSTIKPSYSFLNLIQCDTNGQLWCKSRAINIALKQCDTPYFFVGDVDMMYHPNFIQSLEALKGDFVSYFQVGFLSKEESQLNKEFEAYNSSFNSDEDATGITFYKTEMLRSINGYDEFYHGWGSEDTDVHVRLKNAGYEVRYYDKNILMLHQWHAKTYRTKDSIEPFHSHLEKINEAYLKFADLSCKTKANINYDWGEYSHDDYKQLVNVDQEFAITNKKASVKAIIQGLLFTEYNKVVRITISEDADYRTVKELVKKRIGKKTIAFLSMKKVNDLLLESIIAKLRHCAYSYKFNRNTNQITLTIKL